MNLKGKIEAVLFIAAKPLAAKQLSDLIKQPSAKIDEAAEGLIKDYAKASRGIAIIKNNGKYQMVSAPDQAGLIQEFIKDEISGELSRPSLETLTIITYRGPVSKLDLDRIRGVNCSLILRNLLLRGLIEAREDKKKRETYYNISFDFLRFLGINQTAELPDYDRLHKDDTLDRIIAEKNEDKD